MGSIKKLRYQGSTLLETLIALTILLLCLSIGTMVLTDVKKTYDSFNYIDGWLIIRKFSSTHSVFNETGITELDYNGNMIVIEVKNSEYSPSILIKDFKVLDQNGRQRIRIQLLTLDQHEK